MGDNPLQLLSICMDQEDPDWNPRDDGKKRLIWKEEEVLTLLKLLQKQRLTSKPLSHSQLAEVLMKPLRSMGIIRTVYQIRSKLKNMRKSYLLCKKNGCSPTAINECPYYDILCTIYENNGTRIFSDSDNENSVDIDNKTIWSEMEIKKIISVIDELNLAHELSLNSFSVGALRLISKAMKCSGLYKNVDQVKTALLGLKTSYIDARRNGTPEQCPYYSQLDEIWGSDEIPDHFLKSTDASKTKSLTHQNERRKSEFWSEEETIVLLTSIKELDVIDGAYQCSDNALTTLHHALKDSGYMRSKNQIRCKLENLKQSFINEKYSYSIEETFKRFPFYHLYDSLFGLFFAHLDAEPVSKFEEDDSIHPLDMLPGNDPMERKKHNRSPAWSEEETILMLALIQEMNLVQDIKERMTIDIVSKLVAPLAEHGFCRTGSQIKIKLKNLRTSYQKCYQAGCTPQALADCPFYNRLHTIFQRQTQPKKLDTVRRLEPVDHSYVNIAEVSPDHSYTGVHIKEKSTDILASKKVKFSTNGRQEKNEMWLPVETIPDENDEDSPSPRRPSYDETYKDVRYNDDEDQESDVSHVTGFEEVDEKELYEVNNIQISSKDEFANLIGESTSDFVDKEVDETSNLSKHFIERQVTMDDVRRKLKAEDETSVQEMCETSIQEMCPTTNLTDRCSPINGEKAKSVLKRKRSRTPDEVSVDWNKQMRKSDTESPFRSLLGHTDVPNNTLNKTQESIYVKSMRIVMSEVLTHEKWMQEQHHMWMERQFEIQRKHDRDQRELLLNELRELRRAVTSNMFRPKTIDNP